MHPHLKANLFSLLCYKFLQVTTQAPLAGLEQGKETFPVSGGAEDAAASIVLAISLLPIIKAVTQQNQRCECSTSSSVRLQLQRMRRLLQLPGLTLPCKGLENTSSSAALRGTMGELLLCCWEFTYSTEENVMFCKQRFPFISYRMSRQFPLSKLNIHHDGKTPSAHADLKWSPTHHA